MERHVIQLLIQLNGVQIPFMSEKKGEHVLQILGLEHIKQPVILQEYFSAEIGTQSTEDRL